MFGNNDLAMMGRRGSAALFLTLLGLTSPASAQEGDATLATQLFDEGRDEMKAQRFASACPKLAESARLDEKVGTLAKLAECEEHTGHLAAARAHWQQAMDLARTTGDERAAEVGRELSRVDAIVPKIRIVISHPPSGLTLDLDRARLTIASVGVPLPVDPGTHTLVARAEGRTPWTADVETRADGALTTVSVPELTLGASREASPELASQRTSPITTSPLRTVGPILAAAGAVSLVIGTVFGVRALSDKSAAQDAGCNGVTCPTTAAGGLRDDARAAGTISTIFVATGAALALGGVILWIAAPRSSSVGAGVGMNAAGTF